MSLAYNSYDANEYGYLNENTCLLSGHTMSFSSGQIKYVKNKIHVFLEITVWGLIINDASSSDYFCILLPYEMHARRSVVGGVGYLRCSGGGSTQLRSTTYIGLIDDNDGIPYFHLTNVESSQGTPLSESYINNATLQTSAIYPTNGVRINSAIKERYPL